MQSTKRKITGKISGRMQLLFCILLYLVLLLFVVGLFALSANYQTFYDSPSVVGGSADFSSCDLSQRTVACNLAGEWEFFYGRWLITDGGEDAAPDGLLSVPGHWTMRDFGNGALPRSGYASYRITLYHVCEGTQFTVFRVNTPFAFRIFVNGQLVSSTGVLSKEISETVVTGKREVNAPYLADGGPLEVVIELSATGSGGLTAPPWFSCTGGTERNFGTRLRNFCAAALGVATVALLLSVLMFVFFRYKRDLSMPALITALYLHFFFSKEMLGFFTIPYLTALLLEALSAAAVAVTLLWHLSRAGVRIPWRVNAVAAAAACLFIGASAALWGTELAALPALLLIAVLCAYLPLLTGARALSPALRGVYGVLYILVLAVFTFELSDFFGLIVFGTEFIFSVVMMFAIACFAAVALWRITEAARTAIRAGELEKELMRVKQQALKAQIKPHFIFNSLTAIQSLYREDLSAGDEALGRFARHLRLNIDSYGSDAVPFEDEVKNILNYFELENMRAGGKLTLLLDIGYTEFKVPVLSLQPLVENAIRYAKTETRPDGYIQLSSMREEGRVIVRVSDNGRGFDASAPFGVGLTNARERFRMMGAEMTVESREGEGTEITVTIPVEEV